MNNIVSILQIIVAIALIGLIVIQSQGSGLGKSFGGEGSYHSKKGVEKLVYIATVVVAVLFLSLSLISVLLVNS